MQAAYFPETMHFWGADMNNGGLGYGWDRANRPVWQTENQYIRHYWQGGLELVALALNYDAHRGCSLRSQTLLPLAKAVLRFHDRHWPRGTDGGCASSRRRCWRPGGTPPTRCREIAGCEPA